MTIDELKDCTRDNIEVAATWTIVPERIESEFDSATSAVAV